MYKKHYRNNSRNGHRNANVGQRNKAHHSGSISYSDLMNLVEKGNRSAGHIQRQREQDEAQLQTFKFEELDISPRLKQNIASKHYAEPTPIQIQAIPAILEGKDVIGIANTGTGKTAAFLIPLIDRVSRDKKNRVLIITPTRELAFQIDQEFRLLSKGMNIYSTLCIGGTNVNRQKSELKHAPGFVIGTPGRIKDLIQQNCLDLSQFTQVVLDEADMMVDIGFIEEIKFFINLLPKERQSLFFSATIPNKVHEIIAKFVLDPVTVSVKKRHIAENIFQKVIKCGNEQKKLDQLHQLLIQEEFSKVLVFGRTKHGVQKIADELSRRGLKAGAIHGNKTQQQRLRILAEFKSSEINVLLATDVASRGLDIKGVTHVINYDLPETIEDYIHRIGRTGRADQTGIAITLVS